MGEKNAVVMFQRLIQGHTASTWQSLFVRPNQVLSYSTNIYSTHVIDVRHFSRQKEPDRHNPCSCDACIVGERGIK